MNVATDTEFEEAESIADELECRVDDIKCAAEDVNNAILGGIEAWLSALSDRAERANSDNEEK